jgi:hypothetical protein
MTRIIMSQISGWQGTFFVEENSEHERPSIMLGHYAMT